MILETEQEETREKEREKDRQREMERQKQEEMKVEQALFGTYSMILSLYCWLTVCRPNYTNFSESYHFHAIRNLNRVTVCTVLN